MARTSLVSPSPLPCPPCGPTDEGESGNGRAAGECAGERPTESNIDQAEGEWQLERAGFDEGESGAAATAGIDSDDATGGAPLCCACRIESVSGSTAGEERKPPIGDEEGAVVATAGAADGSAVFPASGTEAPAAVDVDTDFTPTLFAASSTPSCGRGVSKAF